MKGEAAVKKALTNGTPHQRITLIGNYVAQWAQPEKRLEPELLTPEEFRALEDSFKTSVELKLYRKFQKLDEIFRVMIMQLSQLSIEYELIETQIALFNNTRHSLNSLNDTFGALTYLVSEECGEKKQIAIWKKFMKDFSYNFPLGSKAELEIEKGDDGKKYAYFRINGGGLPEKKEDLTDLEKYRGKTGEGIGKDFSYAVVIQALGKNLTKVRCKAKTWIATLREVMADHRFHIQPYKHFLDKTEKKIKAEQALLYLASPDELKAKAKIKEDRAFYEGLIKEDEKTRRLLWIPYDEIEIDEKERLNTLELFDRKEITNG